jgi:hypothetical protein
MSAAFAARFHHRVEIDKMVEAPTSTSARKKNALGIGRKSDASACLDECWPRPAPGRSRPDTMTPVHVVRLAVGVRLSAVENTGPMEWHDIRLLRCLQRGVGVHMCNLGLCPGRLSPAISGEQYRVSNAGARNNGRHGSELTRYRSEHNRRTACSSGTLGCKFCNTNRLLSF